MSTTEVWLYGSYARGDQASSSDLDVLVAGEDMAVLKEVDLPATERLAVSRYTWEELEQMASYGSLFLHHLKLEGRPLLETPDQRMRRLLDSLGEYQRAGRELESFRRVLDDVKESLDGDFSPPFEMAVIATAARHAAILGCYAVGEPNFGRDSAFRQLLPRLGYSSAEVGEFIDLYRFRRADDEGVPPRAEISAAQVLDWIVRVKSLIDQVEASSHAR
jgi:predicted nucleotidyltransferase